MKNYVITGILALTISYLPSVQASNDNQFSLAQIPDTQSYFYHPGWADPGQIIDMYQWIIDDHKSGKNTYKYIFHVGDIIEEDGLVGAPNPESVWEWNQANAIFTTIENNMNLAGIKIPYGFVTGNHDTQNSVSSDLYGNGSLLPNTTQQATTFLKARYENKTNSLHVSINIPDVFPTLNPSKFPDNNYLISYYTFQVAGINFIALNIPYVRDIGPVQPPLPLMTTAINNFIASHQSDALVIINSHVCAQGQNFANHKNVIMVVCGHDPTGVSPDGSYGISPGFTFKPSSGQLVYVYRFDYQATYTGKPPSGSNNLPHHPLIRTYDFTLNSETGILSWNVTDIQPWVAENKEFHTTFPGGPAVFGYVKGKYGWTANAVFDSSRKSIGSGSINYKTYLGAPKN